MSDFRIFTDACCDLTAADAAGLGIAVVPMTVITAGREVSFGAGSAGLPLDRFYAGLRAGAVATTAAVNPSAWADAVRPCLERGCDALVLAFSSGLSATYSSARIAAGELREEFPDRKVLVCDTLAVSGGEGLLCREAAVRRFSGDSVEAAAAAVSRLRGGVCQWFTVDDLQYLRRGGRVSGAASAVGGLLQVKPVMHMDARGRIETAQKARGRRASLNALVAAMMRTATDPQRQTVYVGHCDCREDALYVRDQVLERVGMAKAVVYPIGPVIGAHAGPGAVGLFFFGAER